MGAAKCIGVLLDAASSDAASSLLSEHSNLRFSRRSHSFGTSVPK